MAANKLDIVSIGDCSVDHFVVPTRYVLSNKGRKKMLGLEYSVKIPAKEFRLFAGGNALNTAASFRNLGLNTAIITTLGTDLESGMILETMKVKGIDARFIRRDNQATTDKSVVLVTKGERTVISYHCSKKYSVPRRIGTKWIYLTSLGDDFKPLYNFVSAIRRREGVKVAYNPGSRQLMYAMKEVRQMISSVDVLYLNKNEARLVTGIQSGGIGTLLEHLRKKGADKVVITDGKNGAYGVDEEGAYHVGVYPVKRMDATGAGDAFASSTTAALMLNKPLSEAMRWGSVNSAFEVSKVGVQVGILPKKRLLEAIKKGKAPKVRNISLR